jgi:hypothetical protein
MANATATLTVNPWPKGLDQTQLRAIVYGICALLTGGTYTTNGIPINWGAMQDGNFNNLPPFQGNWGPLQTQPQDAWFYSALDGAYQYNFDKTHNTLRINSGGTELANGAAITADAINFRAEFLKNAF